MGELVFILNNLWLVLALFFAYWWLWVPVMLFLAYIGALKKYNQKVYLSGLKWVMLELKVPIDAHKSPKAMEQVFAALHSIGGIGDPPENLWAKFKAWRESVFKGKVPDWNVFEIFAPAERFSSLSGARNSIGSSLNRSFSPIIRRRK